MSFLEQAIGIGDAGREPPFWKSEFVDQDKENVGLGSGDRGIAAGASRRYLTGALATRRA